MQILDIVEMTMVALLAGIALAIACAAMAARYVFPSLMMDWGFEVTIFMSTWAMLLSAARLVGQDGHVRVDVLTNNLPQPVQKALTFAALLCAIGVAIFFIVAGQTVVVEAMRWGEKTTSSLRIPLWYFYLSLPVSMCLTTLHAFVRMIELVTGVRYHPTPPAAH